MLNYLKEAKMLSNQNKIFRSLILSSSTFSLFYDFLPGQMQKDVSISNLSTDGSIDERLDCLFKVLWLNLWVTVRMLDISAKCRIRGLFMNTGYARLTADQLTEVSYYAVIYGLVLKDFRRD